MQTEEFFLFCTPRSFWLRASKSVVPMKEEAGQGPRSPASPPESLHGKAEGEARRASQERGLQSRRGCEPGRESGRMGAKSPLQEREEWPVGWLVERECGAGPGAAAGQGDPCVRPPACLPACRSLCRRRAPARLSSPCHWRRPGLGDSNPAPGCSPPPPPPGRRPGFAGDPSCISRAVHGSVLLALSPSDQPRLCGAPYGIRALPRRDSTPHILLLGLRYISSQAWLYYVCLHCSPSSKIRRRKKSQDKEERGRLARAGGGTAERRPRQR